MDELKACLDTSDFPIGDGNRPLRGTRLVAHSVSALERILDRFGAYLVTRTEDRTTKPADREKLKGYIRKWGTSGLCGLL